MRAAGLLAELLEILTPPERSYEKTDDGTVDLLEKLEESFSDIVGGAWAEFFPRGEVSRHADASAQFWVACLHERNPEVMARGFQGPYTLANKDKLAALDQGVEGTSGLAVDGFNGGAMAVCVPDGGVDGVVVLGLLSGCWVWQSVYKFFPNV